MNLIIEPQDEFTKKRLQNIAKDIETQQRLNKAQIELKITYLAILDAYNSLLELGINNKDLFNLKYELELKYYNIKR